MNENKVIDAVSEIDGELIEEYFIIDERLDKQRARRKRITRRALAAASFLLAAVMLLSIFSRLLPRAPLPQDLEGVLWQEPLSPQPQPSSAFTPWCVDWGKVRMDYRLYDRVEAAGEQDIIAMRLVPETINNEGLLTYSYKGMTVEEWQERKRDSEERWKLLDALITFGPYLKYGEKLVTEGTPEGEKWVRELYEETRSKFPPEMLDAYIQNGEFFEEQAKKDLDLALKKSEDMKKTVAEAAFAYRAESGEKYCKLLKKQGASAVVQNGDCYLFATKVELEALDFSEFQPYYFIHALKRAFTKDKMPVFTVPQTEFALPKMSVSGNEGQLLTSRDVVDVIERLVEQAFYNCDSVRIRISAKQDSEIPLLKEITATYEGHKVGSKYLSWDSHYYDVRYDDIDLELLAKLSQDPNVESISIVSVTNDVLMIF